LVQSFEADPAAPVPKLWQQRLGSSEAPDRWARHGRGTWWLIWLDDGEPLLALPSAPHSSALDLLFADELHRSSFDQLPYLKRREPSALEQRCLRLLALGDAPNLRSNPLKRMGQQQLRLRARPDQLARLGWLGPGWPRVVGKAPQLELEMTALPKQQQPGWLRLQLDVR
jgi:hypothetical protein